MAKPAPGYIVCDDTLIWGAGSTEAEAWADFSREIRIAGHVVVEPGSAAYRPEDAASHVVERDTFCAFPATAALMDLVNNCGGNVAWTFVGDTACTLVEG